MTQVRAQVYAETYAASITLGGCVRPPVDSCNPTNASTKMQGGKAVFENDNYRITCGDDNEVLIHNKNTGETYRAWGDPHMEIDGQQAFDFWGTTTLCLDDGTKVTIETTPWKNNPSMTLSSKVTITNGGYGVQISGVDTNRTGDLHIDETHGFGRLLDATVDDGNRIYENSWGKGFVAVDDCGRVRKVDQKYIDKTDLEKGGKLAERFKNAFGALAGLISIAFVGAFLGALAGARDEREPRAERPEPRPLPRPGDDPIWTGGAPHLDESRRSLFHVSFELTMVRYSAQMA